MIARDRRGRRIGRRAYNRPPRLSRPWSDAEMLDALRAFAACAGRTPSAAMVYAAPRSEIPTPVTYAARFGSWTKAISAAGLEPLVRGGPHWASKRERCRKNLHAMTPANTYVWHPPSRRDAGQPPMRVCRACHIARRYKQHEDEKRARRMARARSTIRVVRQRHPSLKEIQRHWGMAS